MINNHQKSPKWEKITKMNKIRQNERKSPTITKITKNHLNCQNTNMTNNHPYDQKSPK